MKKLLLITVLTGIFQCQASPRERFFAAIARARITGKPLVLTVERKSYWQGTQGKRVKYVLELGALFAAGNAIYKVGNFVTSEEFCENFQEEFKQTSQYQDIRDVKNGMHTYVFGIAMPDKNISLSEKMTFKRTQKTLLENKNDLMFHRWIKQECERFYSQYPELAQRTLESLIEKDLDLKKGALSTEESDLEKKILDLTEKLLGLKK